MKKPRPKKRKSKHDKFVEPARAHGADESEEALKVTLGKIAPRRGETHLEMAERHIAEQEWRIAEQRKRSDQLRADGHEAAAERARTLLDEMLNMLDEMRKHRDLILDLEKDG